PVGFKIISKLPLLPPSFKKRDSITSGGEDYLCFDLGFRPVAIFKKRERSRGSSKDLASFFFSLSFSLFFAPTGQHDDFTNTKCSIFQGSKLKQVAKQRNAIPHAGGEQIRYHYFHIALLVILLHSALFLSDTSFCFAACPSLSGSFNTVEISDAFSL